MFRRSFVMYDLRGGMIVIAAPPIQITAIYSSRFESVAEGGAG